MHGKTEISNIWIKYYNINTTIMLSTLILYSIIRNLLQYNHTVCGQPEVCIQVCTKFNSPVSDVSNWHLSLPRLSKHLLRLMWEQQEYNKSIIPRVLHEHDDEKNTCSTLKKFPLCYRFFS